MFHTIEWYNFIPNRLDFIPNEVGFTREMNLFIPKLNKSYHASWADTARRAGAVEGVATDARGMKRTGDTSSSSEESDTSHVPGVHGDNCRYEMTSG